MRYLFLIILFFSLSGCKPDKELSAFSTAMQEVIKMIDEGYIISKYIILYEIKSDTLGTIYKIEPSVIPIEEWSLERPEKVIEYKGQFICFISPTAQSDISYKKLLEMTDFENDTDSTFYDIHRNVWFLGVSKDGKKHSLVNYLDADARTFNLYTYAFPKLWKYFSKDNNEKNPPRFILGQYNLIVDNTNKSKDSLKEHLQAIRAEIYYYNNNDEYFIEAKSEENKPFFAVLNGKDTLKFNFKDTLYQHLWLESTPNSSFFKVLPEDKTWYNLYNLMRDSTFYFQFEVGKYIKHPVVFGNYSWIFGVVSPEDRVGYHLYKEGVNEVLKEIKSYDRWVDAE